MAIIFPNPAGQTPVNTFSPTSTPNATTNGLTYIWDSTLGVWTSSAGGGSTLSAATLAEAAAGTLTTVYSSPETAVPKTSTGMAGAAIIPSGPAASTPAAGAGRFRYYSDTRGWFGNDGTDWVSFDQRKPVSTSVAYAAKANDYVVVKAAGQTITLPAAPADGVCVTVAVDGTFLDTVVARGVGTDTIMGLAQDLTLNKKYAAMQLTYSSSDADWRLN